MARMTDDSGQVLVHSNPCQGLEGLERQRHPVQCWIDHVEAMQAGQGKWKGATSGMCRGAGRAFQQWPALSMMI